MQHSSVFSRALCDELTRLCGLVRGLVVCAGTRVKMPAPLTRRKALQPCPCGAARASTAERLARQARPLWS